MKKYLILIIFSMLLVLSGCKEQQETNENAFFEVADIKKTNSKEVLGSAERDLVIPSEFMDALIDFSYMSASDLLEERNGMFSPLSLFIALSGFAELTDGVTKDEVMNVLGLTNQDILREGNQLLYRKLSYENDISTFSIANSIWLRNNAQYNEAPLRVLRDKYYSSSYGVDFSSMNDKQKMNDWVLKQTRGRLGEDMFNNLTEETFLVLINTLYFIDEWVTQFDKDYNTFSNFGEIENVEYMNNTQMGSAFKTDKYEFGELSFKNGFKIKFLMPNEDVSFNSILESPNKLKEAFGYKSFLTTELTVKLPKFTYKSSFDLNGYLKHLGLELIFSGYQADFSPITKQKLFLSEIFQETFINIDEDGGEAAAVTAGVCRSTSVTIPLSILILDRPFIYAICSGDLPIFVGVVNNPNSKAKEQYSFKK